MTALEQVNEYLKRLRRRLRVFAAWRGAALVAGLGLGLTVALVWVANRYEFTERLVLPLRLLLYVALASAIGLLVAIPISKLTRRKVAGLAEERAPEYKERLLTLTERPDSGNPFTELVAEDTLLVARQHQPEQFRSVRALASVAGSGVFAAAALVWLITSAPGYWGYGASLLWTGNGSAAKRPLYDVSVNPGNKTIRRKTDQMITAQPLGFAARRVALFARYGNGSKWEQAAMQPNGNTGGYEFLLAGVTEPVEYYVAADAAQSRHFTIRVKDLPGVKRVKVALHYPAGLGLTDEVQDPGGDVRAVEGTQADIGVLTDRPLAHGLLMTEDGRRIDLQKGEDGWLMARMGVEKDGAYHLAALEDGETIRISEDYFLEAKKDEPPSVKMIRPGRDLHVSPIEEVPVEVNATDDFGLRALDLRYSVNGGAEQIRPLLRGKDSKDANAKITIAFEDLKLVPGDVVSFYATARDAKKTVQSDIVFAQAEPFDFKFSQSQQSGGMGGGMGMGDQENISERQKQIIAATFNELRTSGESEPDQARSTKPERTRFLSDLEEKLGTQAKTLADRMASREMSTAGPQMAEFSRLMTQASAEMNDAAGDLKPGRWHDALAPEQKALQSMLRAEALFRDLQVAFGQQSGSGSGSGAQRDLARMFDLELDTSKNQYETGQTAAQKGQDQQKAIDEAFEKLQMLAQRQQELASQRQDQQVLEQRWQEEQLRREADELRRQMEQLSQDSQGQSASRSQQGSQSATGAGSPGNRQQSASARNEQHGQERSQALQQAANSVQQAEEEMRKAVSGRDGTAQRRAAEHLQGAQETLRRMLHEQTGNSVGDLAQKAQEIAGSQKDLAERIKQMYGGVNGREFGEQGRPPRQLRDFSGEGSASGAENGMPEMNDPNSVQFGYGFRRRNWPMQIDPPRAATPREKALANQKERLAEQLEQLQQGIQREAQRSAGAQPGVSSKLRKALSDAEQKELAVRMQKNAEWMRQGYGDRNLAMEDGVTTGVEQLSRDLQDAERSAALSDAGTDGQSDKTMQALSQVRALREQLEQQRAGRNGRDGKPAGQASGELPSTAEGEGGEYSPSGGRGAPGLDRHGVEDALEQLNTLRRQIDPKDRVLGGYFNDALGNIRHLTGAQSGLLDERISREAALSLERLEVELRKRVGDAQQGARTGAPEAAPEIYRDAVAEYFKKLSK